MLKNFISFERVVTYRRLGRIFSSFDALQAAVMSEIKDMVASEIDKAENEAKSEGLQGVSMIDIIYSMVGTPERAYEHASRILSIIGVTVGVPEEDEGDVS